MSIPGMAVATLICLVATALAMSEDQRFSKIALVMFAFAWLIFYVSMTMPIRFKKRSASGDSGQ